MKVIAKNKLKAALAQTQPIDDYSDLQHSKTDVRSSYMSDTKNKALERSRAGSITAFSKSHRDLDQNSSQP